jgi:hypothetical protein
MAGLGEKKTVQKVVKKLSKSSKSCQKVVKHFVKPGKNEQIRENNFFFKCCMILKIGYDFEKFVSFLKLGMILKIGYDFENKV